MNLDNRTIVTEINSRALASNEETCLTHQASQRKRKIRLPLAALTALALTALAGCGSLPPVADSQPTYIVYDDADPRLCNNPDDNILRSVVRVATDDGGDASGVVVATDRVLTAAHVVINSRLTHVNVNGIYREARLLAIDPSDDLALLSVETSALRPVRLSQKRLYDYEQVWAIGYPLALEQVTTHGYFRNRSEGRLFTSARIEAGASGGGLVRCENGHFELAGLIRGYGAYRIGDELIPLHDLSIHTPAEKIQRFVYQTDGMSL